MIRGDELDTARMKLRDQFLDHALQPQDGLFFGDGRRLAQGLASDRTDETERETLRLRRHAALVREHLADLEEHRALELVRRIAPERTHHLRQQRVTHHAIFGGNGVRNDQTVRRLAGVEIVQLLLRQEAVVHRLGEAERETELADAGLRLERRVAQRRDRGRRRHRVRNVVQAVDAGDFLDEIRLEREIVTPARNAEGDGRLARIRTLRARRETEILQNEDHRVIAHGNADQTTRTLEVKRHVRVERLLAEIGIDHALRDLRRTVLLQKMRRTTAGEIRQVLVDAANVAVARLARETELRRRVLGGSRLEEGRLKHHRRGAGGNAGILAAHDASDGIRLLRVADDEH